MAKRLTRAQIKYFGTKRQRAALKSGGRKKKKRVAGASKPTARRATKRKKKRTSRSRVTGVTITKTRRRRGIRGPMKFGKDKLVSGAIHGAAAFGGGYASGMVEDKLPIDDPTTRTIATGALGLLLTMVDPKGPIGAAGMGMIGGAGRSLADAPDTDGGGGDAAGSAALRGPGKRNRLKRFRMALANRTKYSTVTGMPDDRGVITGPGGRGASYPANPMKSRF